MMFSGSQSYYDQHRHTSGVDKIAKEQMQFNKPTLLTDRGAYLNYLEVQLERVSTACLSVQAYDDRFNDMQSLIVSLDSKIQTLNKMAVFSQERSDDVQSNVTSSVERIKTEFSDALSNLAQRMDSLSVTESNRKFQQPSSPDYDLSIRVAKLEADLLSTQEQLATQNKSILKILSNMESQIAALQVSQTSHSNTSTNTNILESNIPFNFTKEAQQITNTLQARESNLKSHQREAEPVLDQFKKSNHVEETSIKLTKPSSQPSTHTTTNQSSIKRSLPLFPVESLALKNNISIHKPVRRAANRKVGFKVQFKNARKVDSTTIGKFHHNTSSNFKPQVAPSRHSTTMTTVNKSRGSVVHIPESSERRIRINRIIGQCQKEVYSRSSSRSTSSDEHPPTISDTPSETTTTNTTTAATAATTATATTIAKHPQVANLKHINTNDDTPREVSINKELSDLASAFQRLLSYGPIHNTRTQHDVTTTATNSNEALSSYEKEFIDKEEDYTSIFDQKMALNQPPYRLIPHSNNPLPSSSSSSSSSSLSHRYLPGSDRNYYVATQKQELWRAPIVPWRPNKNAQPLSWPLSKAINTKIISHRPTSKGSSASAILNRKTSGHHHSLRGSRYLTDDSSTLSSTSVTAKARHRNIGVRL